MFLNIYYVININKVYYKQEMDKWCINTNERSFL